MNNGQPPSGALEAQIHALAVDRVKNRSYYHVQDLCSFAKEVLALAQPAEGGVVERAVQESWINTIRRASRSIGMTRDDSIVLCHIADHMERTTPPASQEQAQQPEKRMVPIEAVHEVERERDYWRTRAKTMIDHANGEFWGWQGDGEDHLESMANSMPVVVRADQLRELLAQQSSGVVHVCHLKDSVCGDHPANWCDECPKRKQQPSTQAWANETGMRQIECPSCGDLAVAYDPQQPSPATPADMAVYQSIADGYTKAQQLSGEVVASPWVVSSKEQA